MTHHSLLDCIQLTHRNLDVTTCFNFEVPLPIRQLFTEQANTVFPAIDFAARRPNPYIELNTLI